MESSIEKSEERLHATFAQYMREGERAMSMALEMQRAFAERLMLASGAALGVLGTLIATDSSWLQPKEFLVPVLFFVASILASGVGVWLRSIAFLKNADVLSQQGAALGWMKANLEEQVRTGTIGKVPPPTKPEVSKFPERLMSALDILVVISGGCFALGLVWASMSIVWGSPHPTN